MKRFWPILVLTFFSRVLAASPKVIPSEEGLTLRADLMVRCMLGNLPVRRETLHPSGNYPNNYFARNGLRSCRYAPGEFMDYLTIQPNRWCDYSTGNEAKLRTWILSRPQNSITPVSLFRVAMRMNGNHVFNSLLTIHQLLRNEARWRSKRYYSYNSTPELESLFWSKFIDIRGDLKEKGPPNEGDHQGSWYRIWGMAMYRLSLVDPDCGCESIPRRLEHGLETSIVGISAELVKYLYDFAGGYPAGPDRAGKARMNSLGHQMAAEILDNIGGVAIGLNEQRSCENRSYVLRHSNFIPTAPHR